MTLSETISDALASGYARIRVIEHDGRFYWLKQRERLDVGMRIRKGNAARAFDAERSALKSLADKGLPVAPIVAEGPDWFVLEDGGMSLKDTLRNRDRHAFDSIAAFEAAGRALADLHAAGVAHGRASIKDILWNGSRITFIDFERYREDGDTIRQQALDIFVLVQSGFATSGCATPELEAALQAYRSNGGETVWQAARRLCRRMRWLKPVLAPAQLRKAGRGKDVRAAAQAIAYLAGREAD